MAISLLPDPPSRGDSTNFAAKGDALLSALPGFVTEANALAEDVNAKQAATDAAAAVATEMAGIATSRADIATTKAGEAAASEAAAFAYKGAAATSASNASGSEAAAAASAATVDAKGFATDYAGPAEPPVMWPLMTWADTGNMLLKRRNAAGTAWVTLGPLLSYGSPSLTFKAAPSAAPDDVVVQSQAFGVDQTWKPSTLPYAVARVNTGPKAIELAVSMAAQGGSSAVYIQVVQDGVSVNIIGSSVTVAGDISSVTATIPSGAAYAYLNAGGGMTDHSKWELS